MLPADVQAKQPTCELWEERLAHYANVAEELSMLQQNVDIGFVSISMSTLASAIREEALAWLRALWECMRTKDKAALKVTHRLNCLVITYQTHVTWHEGSICCKMLRG